MSTVGGDHPGLLTPGFHPMDLEQVQVMFVDKFKESKTRGPIFAGLKSFLNELSAAGLLGDVWLDGSFVTEKPDPRDCDLVVCADALALEAGSPSLHALVTQRFLTGKAALKTSHHCDAYIFPRFPASHLSYGITQAQWAYWEKQFGFDRSKVAKGMALIKLPVQP